LKNYGDIDSKFRYVILASMRAKQLLRGAKPLIKSKSKNLIRVAQEEVKKGLVDFEIVKSSPEETPSIEEEMFIGEEIEEEMREKLTKQEKPEETVESPEQKEKGSKKKPKKSSKK
jgi:DNA-directed RNA polymerase omega subunit